MTVHVRGKEREMKGRKRKGRAESFKEEGKYGSGLKRREWKGRGVRRGIKRRGSMDRMGREGKEGRGCR